MNLIKLYRNLRNKILYRKRKSYFAQLREIFRPSTSIISSNCFAGRIMQDLNYEYNSPTLGLYFFAEDYILFLKNLKYNLSDAKLTFIDKSKYPLANERRAKCKFKYPIGLLDGKIEIHFLHYHSKEEAEIKWRRRAQRVNFNDLIVIGMQQNLPSEKTIQEFDNLPFDRKVYFTTRESKNLKCATYVHEFSGMEEVGDPYKKGHIFYKYLIDRLLK